MVTATAPSSAPTAGKTAAPTWQEIGSFKRKSRDAKIPFDWKLPESITPDATTPNLLDIPRTSGILSRREIEITETYDAVDLGKLIRDGTCSAEEVTVAFCKRAAIAQQLVNCLSEIFFEEAIARARQLDEERRLHPSQPLKPLHGIPISLKDSFRVQGVDSSIGIAALAGNPAQSNSALVDILISQGAVPFCKTNAGQLMVAGDTDNNVFGRTLNPHNTRLTAGGSSGGEAALVALRGSVLGVGSDLGGSIRGPCAAAGVYGLKPSADIVPYAGQQSPSAPAVPVVMPSAGPLATSARACGLFLEAVMRAEPWRRDVACLRMPWTGAEGAAGPMRIACLADDGVNTPTPPLRRVLAESMEKLRRAGHIVVPVRPPVDVLALQELVMSTFPLDGNKHFLRLLEMTGEPLVPSVAAIGLPSLPPRTLMDVARLHFARHQARRAWSKMWQDGQFDALVTFVAPHTAVPLDKWTNINLTGLFNLLDCPACVLPLGKVTPVDVVDRAAKYGAHDEAAYSLYNGPDYYKDAPVCLQVVGERQNDEEFMAVATRIDDVLSDASDREFVWPGANTYALSHARFCRAFGFDQSSSSDFHEGLQAH